MSDSLSAREARWLAIAAQGLDRDRARRRAKAADLLAVIEKLGAVQLDAVNVLERTQFITLYSRLGPYDRDLLHTLTGPGRPVWEYAGHAASLMPVGLHPLLRWRMTHGGTYVPGPKVQARIDAWWAANADYFALVLKEVEQRGPLTAAELSDPKRRTGGEWWERQSEGKRSLDGHFYRGRLAAWRNPSFELVYDVPERVIPPAVLAQPTPPDDEAQRRLVLLSANALGVATTGDLASYFMLQPRVAKARVAELVEAGQLVGVEVEGWTEPGYLIPSTGPRPPKRRHATLLSPFDSLIWDRKRTKRLFGFDYIIEIYVPAPKRRHGYYVLPLLLGDELVARFDLKADRAGSTLLVNGAFLEPAVKGRKDDVVAAAVAELDTMRAWLGLESVAVAGKGDLAPALRRAV